MAASLVDVDPEDGVDVVVAGGQALDDVGRVPCDVMDLELSPDQVGLAVQVLPVLALALIAELRFTGADRLLPWWFLSAMFAYLMALPLYLIAALPDAGASTSVLEGVLTYFGLVLGAGMMLAPLFAGLHVDGD